MSDSKRLANFFKPSVLNLEGYASPPQKQFKAKLNQNESPFDVPDDLKELCLKVMEKIEWNRYPINESPGLRHKLAERHEVAPEQILLGSGSNQIFQTLLTATLRPGDVSVVLPPTFSLYELFLNIYDGEVAEVLIEPDAKDFPLEQVLATINETQPKLTFLCSPNNPTGAELDLDHARAICEAAPGLVFFDEAYGEFSEQTAVLLLPQFDNLIISRTFSKAFSMAGLRFGYFITSPDIIAQLRKVNIPYNVNLFTEAVALMLLDHQELMQKNVDYLKTERDRMAMELRQMEKITVYPSAANFLLIKGPEEINLFAELKNRGVLVRDVGSYPLLGGFQRVSVGFRDENNLFLDTLKKIVEG